MEEDQVARSQERVRVMAETVGLSIGEDRVPILAEAFDGVRLMIARLEPIAARVDVPVNAPYDASWDEGERGQ